MRPGSFFSALALAAAVALCTFAAPREGCAQEKTVSLSFTKDLLYNIARDNEGELNEQVINRLKGLSPSVSEVALRRSGGDVTLSYTVDAGGDLRLSFNFTLEKMAYYRMAAARADIDGMLKILSPAMEEEPLIRNIAYRYNEHYSIVDVTLDLRPAIAERDKEQKKAAAALAPPPPKKAPPPEKKPPAPKEPPPSPQKKEPPKEPPPPKKEPPAPKEPPPPREPDHLAAFALGKIKPPVIDGQGGDEAWGKAAPFSIPVKGESGRFNVTAAALWGGGKVYLLFQWPDQEANLDHRPWTWSAEDEEYLAGKELEDGLAVQLSRKGSLGDCMLSGRSVEADLWFWRAARTDPVGYAEDGTMVVSAQRIAKANFYEAHNKRTVWFKENHDSGTAPYRTEVAGAYEGDRVRRYVPREPSGSAADVRAKGEWKSGTWTVEFSRALDTGDDGDAVLRAGGSHYFSIALFNGRERSEHSTSREHQLRLE